jgi:hypothetical protein
MQKTLSIEVQMDKTTLGWFNRLLAQYLAIPLHQFGVYPKISDFQYGNATSPLVHLWEAVSHHSYVVMFRNGWNAERHEITTAKSSEYFSSIVLILNIWGVGKLYFF